MRTLCALLLVACALQIYPGFAQTQARRVFIFEDVSNRQWCALDNKEAATAAIQKADAMTVATGTYPNGRLSQLSVEEAGESGDWIVFDTYFLGDEGKFSELVRVINYATYNVSVSQTFSLNSGRAVKTATTIKDLDTGKSPASRTPDWLPELPIRTHTGDFSFAGLLDRRDFSTTAKICVPISDRK